MRLELQNPVDYYNKKLQHIECRRMALTEVNVMTEKKAVLSLFLV